MSTSRSPLVSIAIAALALCACAAPPAPLAPIVQEGGPNDVKCHMETVTGSMFKERVCLSKAERDARQALTDDMKTGLDRQRSIACPNGSAPPCK